MFPFPTDAITASTTADTFINVASNNGAFDIFQSAREKISSSLYQAGIFGAVSRQAYKIYRGVSALSSSSSSNQNTNPLLSSSTNKNKNEVAKEWSSGSMKRLENFVRLGAAGYSCHLGANIREYIKRVFDHNPNNNSNSNPLVQASQQQQQQKPLTREEKIAKLSQQCRSRLAGLVVTPVIQSYLFTIEIMLAAVAHPVALYEIHKIQTEEFGGISNNSGLSSAQNNNTSNNNSNRNDLSFLSSHEGVPLTTPEDASASSSWFTKALNVAMKLSIGTPPPPQLLQPPPVLELKGSLAAPSAEASSSSSGLDDKSATSLDDDDDDNDDEQRRKNIRKNCTELNEMLLNLIRGMKQETESYLEAILGGPSFFENLTSRVATEKIEEALQKAISNPALYQLAPPGLEWMIDIILMDKNHHHLHQNQNQNPFGFGGITSGSSGAGDGASLLEIDQRVTQTYYRLLNQIVATDSFNRLMHKGAESIFEKSVTPALDDTWPTLKSYLAASEELQQQQPKAEEAAENSTGAAAASSSSPSSSSAPTPSPQKPSSTVQVAHLGAGLTTTLYITAETELTKILFPELFVVAAGDEEDDEEKKSQNSNSISSGSNNNLNDNDQNNNNNNDESEEDRAKREEKVMRERQLKMMRTFPSFGDLSTYGGLCMQFARFTIESNVGGEFFIQQE